MFGLLSHVISIQIDVRRLVNKFFSVLIGSTFDTGLGARESNYEIGFPGI